MKTVSTAALVRAELDEVRRSGRKVSFVPTMGALHDGHLSLVELARAHGEFCVMSIFVNPTQFNSPDDLLKYPRMLEVDQQKAESSGVDLVFAPSVEEMYSDGAGLTSSPCFVRAGSRSQILEGAFRPGHFDGVVTVVAKLFNIVQPSISVFGQKDFQQVQVIKQMVEDLCFPVDIVVGPTVREIDGLAIDRKSVV